MLFPQTCMLHPFLYVDICNMHVDICNMHVYICNMHVYICNMYVTDVWSWNMHVPQGKSHVNMQHLFLM